MIIRVDYISKEENWFETIQKERITVTLFVIGIVISEFQDCKYGTKLFSPFPQG
jgi:hypothetical protein